MTLTEFLLARIAEDEAAARAAMDDRDTLLRHEDAIGNHVKPGEHLDRWNPARVLAECEAKRRIVEAAQEAHRAAASWTTERLRTDTRSPLPEYARADAFTEALRFLALPYADHPDYDEAWRP